MNVKDIIKAAGGVTSVARTLGIKHPSVCGWRRVPAEHVMAVSRLTGIPPHQLRQDVFPAPEEVAA